MISHLTSVIYNTQQKAKHDFLSFGLSWGLFSIDNLIQFNAISTQHVRTRTQTQSIIETGATRRRLRRTYHFERALSHIEWFPQHTIIITIHIGDNMYSGVSTPLCQREWLMQNIICSASRLSRRCADTGENMCLCVCVRFCVLYREFSVLPLATTTTTPPPTERKIRRLLQRRRRQHYRCSQPISGNLSHDVSGFSVGCANTHTHVLDAAHTHFSFCCKHIAATLKCKSVEPVNGNNSAASLIFEWKLWNILIQCKLMYFDP